jgi:hypothetical protein
VSKEVNISLRGVLEELPLEVAELLLPAIRRIGDAEAHVNGVIERLEGGQDVNHCIVDLEASRQLLYRVDSRLNDCVSILSGYVQYINNPELAQERQDSPPEGGSED